MGKGKGREVERWDPPNSVMPKLPFPAWGATSKFIRHSEGCCVVKAVERKNDYAENAPKVDVPKEGEGLSYPVSKIEKSSKKSAGLARSKIQKKNCYPKSENFFSGLVYVTLDNCGLR